MARSAILDSLRNSQRPNLREIAAQQSALLRQFQGRVAASATVEQPGKDATWTAKPVEPDSILHAYIEQVDKLVPAKYALRRADGGLDFLEVVERKGGRRYINRLIGAPGDYQRVKLSYRLMWHAARHLAEDPKAALALYGHEAKTCGKCDSPLTRKDSRDRGYGPVCAKAFL